jgi:hypothetical protein
MKKFTFFIIFTLITFNIGFTKDHNHGIGIIVGEPTGISFKHWTSKKTAFDAAIAWSTGKNRAFHIHADYLIHNFHILDIGDKRTSLYYGIGGRFRENDSNKLGVRFPIGIDYIFKKIPIEIFFEIAPIFDLTPKTEFNFNGGIGVRYLF